LEEAEVNKTNITNIILNPVKYHPRKISNEESKIEINSKFDNVLIKPDSKRNSKIQYNKYDDNYTKGRKKALSINYKFTPQNKLPLNKNYEIVNNGKIH
jgi:hypothetical protein